MVESRFAVGVLLAALWLTGACGADPPPAADPPLATLGPRVLRESDFARFTRAAYSPERIAIFPTHPDARREAVGAWLDLTVQAAEARREGIDKLATYRKAEVLMEMKLATQTVMERNRPRLAKPTDIGAAEIERCYLDRPERFQLPPKDGKPVRQPLAEVRGQIADQLAGERNARFHQTFLAALRTTLHFRQTADARPVASLLGDDAVPGDTTIAFLGDEPIREEDFLWFLRDAYRAEQRQQAFSQPGTRRRMLADYLNMRLYQAQATKLGLDRTAAYRDALAFAELRLLAEFQLERDGMTPWRVPGNTDGERAAAFAGYMRRLRSEMVLVVIPSP